MARKSMIKNHFAWLTLVVTVDHLLAVLPVTTHEGINAIKVLTGNCTQLSV